MSKKPTFWQCFQGYRAFGKLPPERRRIVFYSEGKTYWPFLRPFVEALLETTSETPTYVSSEADDPGLGWCPERMTGVTVGAGFMMSMWFSTLDANVLAMTTPDLEVFHVKRSKVRPVHYAYLMHGADSISMVLRERAVDHFDSVFCAGPHNVTEIRRREELEKLPAKTLFEIGYPYQDELIATARQTGAPPPDGSRPLRVLLAPSWSENGTGTLETCGVELVGALLDAGFETILRPHPRTRMLRPECVAAIETAHRGRANLVTEPDTTGKSSLMEADVLISDWSAVALEFAFSRLRPVLYIDVPRKVMNPHYQKLGLEPFEVSVRNEIGTVLAPGEVARAPGAIRRLCADAASMAEHIRNIRDKNVFNVGGSAAVGAKTLVELANRDRSS
ncbi:MAG TPA: CDP-glycerol--glycerophosphate glycerophosphotransferase [Planctomycetaceae bacterium]|nr:CDP-glycerol--glycerophosphate glycerophosphotransferase [Planctomycetaceae bacterium]